MLPAHNNNKKIKSHKYFVYVYHSWRNKPDNSGTHGAHSAGNVVFCWYFRDV